MKKQIGFLFGAAVSACVGLLCVFLSGCESTRMVSTLKPQQDVRFSQPGVTFRIVEVLFDGRSSEATADYNALAMKAYPALFSDKADAWPVWVAVKKTWKKEMDLFAPFALTLGLFPAWDESTQTFGVTVVIPGTEPAPTCFEMKRVRWGGWIPLVVPVPGPADVRTYCFEDAAVFVRYEQRCIAEAVARQVKALDAAAVAKLCNPAEVAKLAVQAPLFYVRRAAVRRLTDQPLLARIAAEDKDSWVRESAAKRLTDQPLLAQLAVNSNDSRVRATAVSKLTNQELLAQIAEKDDDLSIRKTAVAALTDQARLGKIAVEYWNEDLRAIAVSKLTDQPLLGKIALEDKDDAVRKAAAARLSDPVLLAGKGMWFKPELTRKVTDQALLAKIAIEAKDEAVCAAAVGKLADQALLADVLTYAADWKIREAASARIVDPALLAQLAAKGRFSYVRLAAVGKLADQPLLARIARGDGDSDVRKAAAARLSDPALLARMGVWVKPELTRQVTDPALIAQLAAEAKDSDVRVAAVGKLADQALLAKLVVKTENWDVRRAAVARLADQPLLADLASDGKEFDDIRLIAVGRLSVQPVLAKLAAEDKNPDLRKAAVARLSDPTLLAKVAAEAKPLDIRLAAIAKLTDQPLIRRWAEKDPQAAIRQAAAARITDDAFLLKRLPLEPSAAVRATLVRTLRGNDALRQVALTAYYRDNRLQARKRLPSAEIADAHAQLDRRVAALAKESDADKLRALALTGAFDVLRTAAAVRLADPAVLEQVALRADDRDVLKIVLGKLLDKEALKRIAATAADHPMRLAAAQKSGEKTWSGIFDAATAVGAAAPRLGDALAAVAFFPSVQREAVIGVQQACLNMIRHGDESRIPEMAELLEGYGDKTLAEDYINCGQPDLYESAASWGRRRGYNIRTGGGSHRAIWGSGN